MSWSLKFAGGILLAAFALVCIFSEELALVGFIILAGMAFYFRRWIIAIGSRSAKGVRAHVKQVNKTRYCACCGGQAVYFATTAFRDMTREEMTFPFEKHETKEEQQTESLLIAGTPQFYLCTDHHPLIGPKRDETHKAIEPFHKKLTWHFITPNPFM